MRRWIFLVWALAIAFLPLLEFVDSWERPWSGDSNEVVTTCLVCLLALAYGFVRRQWSILCPLPPRVLAAHSTAAPSFPLGRLRVLEDVSLFPPFSSVPLRI